MSRHLTFAPRQSRNVVLHGTRTCIGLEPEMWQALESVAQREQVSMARLIEAIEGRRRVTSHSADLQPSRLTPAIRVFLIAYYRSLSERNDDQSPLSELLGRSVVMRRPRTYTSPRTINQK